MLAGTMATAFQ
jgi:hypothetical protein